MKIDTNYNIGTVLRKIREGSEAPVMLWLKEEIDRYEAETKAAIGEAMEALQKEAPAEPMRWISEHVDRRIAYYCRCEVQGRGYHVLKKKENQWKTVSDIGIPVEIREILPVDHEERTSEWIAEWKEELSSFSELSLPVYETHAHLDNGAFKEVREELLPLIRQAGIRRLILPAIEFSTCRSMKELFDGPDYDWISYAFGSHPKYLWKEKWTEETFAELEELTQDLKCVAIGEAGLDYSYPAFDGDHRKKQQEFFGRMIRLANRKQLPLILHVRAADGEAGIGFDAAADAIEILTRERPAFGAVVHCFGGDPAEMSAYLAAGATHFGIGGRICYGEDGLIEAVREMPEECILLETDSPYIKIGGGRKPNTPLALSVIAAAIAKIRQTTTEHILQVTFDNAVRLFGR